MTATKRLGIVDAFRVYGAKLKNFRWAVSSIASDGTLVISCWSTHFTTPNKDTLRYSDSLNRWNDINPPGRELLAEHITAAYRDKVQIRLVMAHLAKNDAPKKAEYFHVRQDLVGLVSEFDGDLFTIDFQRLKESKV